MPVKDIVGGATGSVTLPTGFGVDITDWDATVASDVAEWQPMASESKKTKVVSLSLSGSCQGTAQFNAAATNPLPTGVLAGASFAGSFVLTAETGCTLSFTGNITSSAITRPGNERVTVAYQFVSDGDVTVAWDVV